MFKSKDKQTECDAGFKVTIAKKPFIFYKREKGKMKGIAENMKDNRRSKHFFLISFSVLTMTKLSVPINFAKYMDGFNIARITRRSILGSICPTK